MNHEPRTLDGLLADATRRRRAKALAAAKRVAEALAVRGVDNRVVGSLARGRFRSHSDIDLLVLSLPEHLRYRIETLVEDLTEGLPFHVIYLDEVDPRRRPALLAEAVRASDLR